MKPLITLVVMSLVVLSFAPFEDSSYKNPDETITIASMTAMLQSKTGAPLIRTVTNSEKG